MAGLTLLYIANDNPIRCSDLDDAKRKVKARAKFYGKAIIKHTPEGGGVVTSLEYSSQDDDWVALQE